MKIQITRANLLAALSQCAPIAKQKTTMPVLSCVLLRAEFTRLHVSATNLQQSVTTSTVCETVTDGVAAVGAKDIIERVKTFPEGLITLALDGDTLLITAGKRKHKLPVRDASEFPILAPPPDGKVTLPGAALKTVLELVRPGAAEDLDRPTLNCVLLEFEGATLRAMTTDGKRAHVATETLPVAPLPLLPLMLPLASVDALLGILDGKLDVSIGFGASDQNGPATAPEFAVRHGDTVMTTKLIVGDFPPVRTFFNQQGPIQFDVKREAMADSLRSVATSTPDGELSGKVSMAVDGDEVTISGEGKGSASDSFTLDAPCVGGPLLVSYFVPFMLDAMTGTESVRVAFGPTELSPVYVISSKLTAIVMPCRP